MTLEELLASRDARVERQRELISSHPGMTLLCMTVQLPGPVKKDGRTEVVAMAGVEAVRKAFSVGYEELRDLETGFEAFFIVPQDPLEVKRVSCRIEDTHPLGRLMDLDVIVEGTEIHPLGREELGLPPRKCLLCDNDARHCIRARTHTTEELLAKISKMVENYKNL